MESTNNYIETDLGNVSPNPKGTYDNATAYEYLDLVEYQGGSYLCIAALGTKITGTAPTPGKNTDVWQTVALPGNVTEEYVEKHTDVIEKAKEVETSRAAVELCQQEIEAAQLDVEQMRQDTQQAAQNASDANTEAQQMAKNAEASRTAAQTSEQNAAASRNLANTHKEAAETAKNAAETAAQEAEQSKTAAETAAQQAAQSKTDIDNIKSDIEEAAKGENVTQIQQNMNDIGSLKESLSNKITKFYASNEGKNHLADSDNGKIMDMMLYGKSEQFTTTGKNLLKIKDRTQTTRGVTVTAKDGVLALKGIATGTGWAIIEIDSFVLDGTCILSSNVTTKTSVANESYEQVLEQDKSKTLENVEVSKVCFNIVEGKTYDISNILIQIEKGSVATSYEPYTGGIPSPSPDYPQEIKRVVNPVVKVCGKNLLQPNLRYNDRVKINIKKGAKLTLICKNGVASKGGNLKFENANGEIVWLGIDKGSVKRQIMLKSDVVAYTYLFNSETSENYALYIGDENTYEPYKEQSIQLPITLNAIPVSSGGNVTINGQQYIADYVDVERGKVVRKIDKIILTGKENWMMGFESWTTYPHAFKADGLKENILEGNVANTKYTWHKKYANKDLNSMNAPYNKCIAISDDRFSSVNEFTNELKKQDSNGTPLIAYYITSIPQEENLSLEKIEFLKSLSTYYSVTNVTVDSEQLDGYTVFNYPISMQNGWNYVKQQLNDNRDYIYDTDLQSAEAYVNSEYAVALTELEVM